MPYVLVQGRLDPGGEDGGGGISPLCVSVSGMKATELAEMNSFSPSADKDDKYTVRFPQVSGRVGCSVTEPDCHGHISKWCSLLWFCFGCCFVFAFSIIVPAPVAIVVAAAAVSVAVVVTISVDVAVVVPIVLGPWANAAVLLLLLRLCDFFC